MEGLSDLRNIQFMIDCTQYIIAQRERGYPDQSFYNEYDFICHVRLQKDLISNSSQTSGIQAEALLHREIIS